ncbi:MAG: adenosylmethionine--8-amino-7-oxononanoate transaminase [Pseudomonadota bacterium]
MSTGNYSKISNKNSALENTTERLIELDKQFLWHPFTQMKTWLEEDVIVIERGEGCWLVDTEGNRYLDGISSLWCNLHGHKVAAIDKAIQNQLKKVAHTTLLGLSNIPSIEFAARLVQIVPPGLRRVFYSDAGATAVEAAVKMAFQYQVQTGHPEKTQFAALGHAYHGDTVGSVSLSGIEVMHSMFAPLRFDVIRLPSPYCYRCPLGLDQTACSMECAKEAEQILKENAASLAGVVVEPLVQGAAGIIVHPKGYLARLRKICDELNLLLIADEVATGFGRTGTMFACSQENVVPDLMCLAKGISGGYLPVAATLATEKVFEAFSGPIDSGRTFFHGHTYTGNPLGCAAAIASLDLLETGVLESLPKKQKFLNSLLNELIHPLPHVGDLRIKGLMAGIELVQDRNTKEPWPASARVGHRVICEARKQGVMLRPLGDVVVLIPPLVVSESELELLAHTTAQAIKTTTEQ